jgi:hypothetical protein
MASITDYIDGPQLNPERPRPGPNWIIRSSPAERTVTVAAPNHMQTKATLPADYFPGTNNWTTIKPVVLRKYYGYDSMHLREGMQ